MDPEKFSTESHLMDEQERRIEWSKLHGDGLPIAIKTPYLDRLHKALVKED